MSVIRTRERLRAVLADDESAALLGIDRGAPLLSIRRVALSYNDEPVELRVSRVNTAAHEYYADIGAPGLTGKSSPGRVPASAMSASSHCRPRPLSA